MSREKCKDLVGKRVKLLAEARTVGGKVLPAGTIADVVQTYSGKFVLFDGPRGIVRGVPRSVFEVISGPAVIP